MRKLILFLLVFASAKVSAQVYQEMPQYGYRANRMAFDSTLQIPTVCGVPTLKSIVKANKNGAIAYDSCNAVFYTYNPKTLTWSAVSGGGGATDTTSLSNRINLKVNISDTSNMLSKYLRKTDTATISNRINLKLNISDTASMLSPYLRSIDTTNKFVNNITRTEGKDSIIYFIGANRFAIKDSVGGAGSDTAKVVIAQVHNETATTLLKGEVVYLFGSNGNIASVKRANNKTDATSSKTFGIVRRDIVAGGTGFVTTQGQIEKLNLGSYVEGDVLWLDSLDGQFTKVKPQAPYHGVFLGVVERANNGNGLAYIKPQNGVELDEVHDVQINSILNNQIIVYSDTQLVWKNRSIYSVVDTTNKIATKSNVALKLNATDTASLSDRINTKQNDLDLLQSIGLGIKGESYGITLTNVTTQLTLSSGRISFYPFNWNVSDSIRGIAWFNRATTSVVATNYNGIGIYSLSGGTLTRVTFTANDAAFWTATSNTWTSKSITPFYLTKGVYFIGFQVSGTGTLPIIGCGVTMLAGSTESTSQPPTAVNTNGIKVSSFINNATSSPPSSVAMSALSLTTNVPYFIFY